MTDSGTDAPGRAWARSKLDWLDQVADDLDSSDHLAFRVAHTIARVSDKDTGIADRSQADLAKRVRASVRSLQSAIEKLEARGHLIVIHASNPKRGNRYRPNLHSDGHHTKPASYEKEAHTQSASHENDARHAQLTSHEMPASCEVSYAKSDSFMRSPLRTDSRIDPRDPPTPAPPSSSDITSCVATTKAGAAAASPISDQELFDELWCVAAGRIVKGPGTRDLQPIRELIADGADLDRDILPAVGEIALALSEPLRTWRAPMVAAAVRQRMQSAATIAALIVPAARPAPTAAPSPPPAKPAEPVKPVTRPVSAPQAARVPSLLQTAVRPDEEAAEPHFLDLTYEINGHRIVGEALRNIVNAYYEKNIWPDSLGEPPNHPRCLIPGVFQNWLSEKDADPKVPIHGRTPYDEGHLWHLVLMFRQGMDWPRQLGSDPGTPGCLLPQRFQTAALLGRSAPETDP